MNIDSDSYSDHRTQCHRLSTLSDSIYLLELEKNLYGFHLISKVYCDRENLIGHCIDVVFCADLFQSFAFPSVVIHITISLRNNGTSCSHSQLCTKSINKFEPSHSYHCASHHCLLWFQPTPPTNALDD